MYSTYANYDYPINVFVPNVPAPPNGFPVLFVLDGQRYSEIIFSIMNNQIRMSAKTNVQPMIIVSVGHHNNDFMNRRFFDFTAPSESYTFPMRRGKQMEPKPVGNGLQFKNFLKYELQPYILNHYAADATKFMLYGHSLGGLFSLWVSLTDSSLFAKYVAVSPSIWWNNHELLQLLRLHEKLFTAPSAIYVGSDEGDMVDDAMTFYHHISSSNTVHDFFIAMHENHASVVPTTISKVLRFIST